jgi:hypothetical protein
VADKPAEVQILGADWPGRTLPVMPGDLTQFLPQGLALGQPMIVRPWDDPLKALSGPNYYGVDAPDSHPFRAAPTQEPSGGVIYFDDGVTFDRLSIALEVMGAMLRRADYAVFAAEADDPPNQRFLDQVRIVPKSALGHFFDCDEAAALADQPVPLGDFIEQFITAQRAKWNDPSYTFSSRLSGTLGGDGDWAKESLCFGFLVENTYWGVYRLWRRAWLVTK